MSPPIASGLLRKQLVDWERSSSAEKFPYDAVLAFYWARGKHFVPPSILRALADIRARLAVPADRGSEEAALHDFLNVALDKWDEAYNYKTYLGLDLLGLVPDADGATARQQQDAWVTLLLADTWVFESDALAGRHSLLPLMRPGPELAEKRMRMIASRMSAGGVNCSRRLMDDPSRDDIVQILQADTPLHQRRALTLSMQPVYLVHDEYLFIRILQSFEVTFAAMAGEIRDAIAAVLSGDADSAAACILRCGRTLAAARSLFSILATMRADSFRAFRVYTVGASAIQSGNYKVFEALCSAPSTARIDSPAYESVPDVRNRVLGEWSDLTSSIGHSASRGLIDVPGLCRISAAAEELERIHQMWKQTHWKLAGRMIGDDRGTGYTVGVPYLKSAIDNRLFRHPLRIT
jgi:tryptophan 2,3-dioxygenase